MSSAENGLGNAERPPGYDLSYAVAVGSNIQYPHQPAAVTSWKESDNFADTQAGIFAVANGSGNDVWQRTASSVVVTAFGDSMARQLADGVPSCQAIRAAITIANSVLHQEKLRDNVPLSALASFAGTHVDAHTGRATVISVGNAGAFSVTSHGLFVPVYGLITQGCISDCLRGSSETLGLPENKIITLEFPETSRLLLCSWGLIRFTLSKHTLAPKDIVSCVKAFTDSIRYPQQPCPINGLPESAYFVGSGPMTLAIGVKPRTTASSPVHTRPEESSRQTTSGEPGPRSVIVLPKTKAAPKTLTATAHTATGRHAPAHKRLKPRVSPRGPIAAMRGRRGRERRYEQATSLGPRRRLGRVALASLLAAAVFGPTLYLGGPAAVRATKADHLASRIFDQPAQHGHLRILAAPPGSAATPEPPEIHDPFPGDVPYVAGVTNGRADTLWEWSRHDLEVASQARGLDTGRITNAHISDVIAAYMKDPANQGKFMRRIRGGLYAGCSYATGDAHDVVLSIAGKLMRADRAASRRVA